MVGAQIHDADDRPEPRQQFGCRHLRTETVRGRRSATAAQETEIARLARERDQALEQQAATSEVLQIISRSKADLQPIFAAILKNAVRLCDASFGDIYSWERGALHLLASYNSPPAFAEERRRSVTIPPSPGSPTARMLATKIAGPHY